MKNYLFISILAFTGCRHADDLFKSYGPEITVSRQVGSFDRITAGEKFDIILVQDSTKEGLIELTAGKNVVEGYSTKVSNGELFISNDNKFNWVRKLKVRQTAVVYFKRLNTLQINGSAKFSSIDTIYDTDNIEINHGGLEDASLNVRCNYINVNCSNTGGVSLSGNCFLFSGTADDISYVDTRNLNSKKCYLTSFSRQNSYVNGIEVLEIRLFGAGNVYYNNIPTNILNIEDTGEGNVIKN